jgi:hypothetical protein
LLQLAEMMECEAKPSDISHMDLLYAQIDDITLSEVCQAMENEHSALTIQGCGNILVAARLEYFHTLPSKSASDPK